MLALVVLCLVSRRPRTLDSLARPSTSAGKAQWSSSLHLDDGGDFDDLNDYGSDFRFSTESKKEIESGCI